MASQVTASAAVSGAVRHLIQPQPPGICLTSTYESKTQNTAPRTAMLAPLSTGYAPLHENARHALHAAGCQPKQSPLAPRHPQHPPDGGHIVEVPHAAVQLARPGYHENRTAADGTPRNDRLYDLIDIDHPAAR